MEAIRSATDDPLPPEVLLLVLQYVDPPQRLGPCALVCRSWHAAANAATSSISMLSANQQQATALSGWLHRHGGHVAGLRVEEGDSTLDFALPCHQLTKLDTLQVYGANVCPMNAGHSWSADGRSGTGSSSGSGSDGAQHQPLAALTRLTHLCLEWVQWAGSLMPLSTLTSLQDLHLHYISGQSDHTAGSGASGPLDAAVGSAVSHLVQLTSLSLGSCGVTDAALAHISRLQQLQELLLHDLQCTPASLATLPQSLTELVVLGHSGSALSSSTAPALAQLTALQHLELVQGWALEPILLSQMAQLTRLRLDDGAFVPAGSVGAAALLAAVARMTQLQHLELMSCLNDSHAPEAAYAALTASSHLTHLYVFNSAVHPLPSGALHHMFATGRQLPSLQGLLLGFKQQQQQPAMLNPLMLRQRGFDQLLQCCPGLHDLQLSFEAIDVTAYQPPIDPKGLLSLSGLTRLALTGLSVDERGITNTLVQLTGLRDLTIHHTAVNYTALLQLTKLKELEHLRLCGALRAEEFEASAVQHHYFYNMAPPGSPPDVWRQLQERCVSSCKECARLVGPECTRLVEQQKETQLSEDKALLEEVSQQLDHWQCRKPS